MRVLRLPHYAADLGPISRNLKIPIADFTPFHRRQEMTRRFRKPRANCARTFRFYVDIKGLQASEPQLEIFNP